MKKNQKGFTMIELLVVVGIIGILTTIVLSFLGSSRDKANDSKIRSQLSSMRTQANLYEGPMPAGGSTYGSIIPIPNAANMFADATPGANSLRDLINGLPKNTDYYYWSNANILPSVNGHWYFAATTSDGAFCVDWTGETFEFVGPTPTTIAQFDAAFPTLSSQTRCH